MMNTPYPAMQPTIRQDSQQMSQMSTMVICFIALGALIALLLMICLFVLIYNLCRYGSCCPPSSYPSCCCPASGCICPCYCATCCDQPGGVQYVKSAPVRTVRSSSFGNGTYVGRGTRFNQATYLVDPGTLRSGTLPRGTGRRNSVIIVGDGTLSRRRSIRAPVRPQVLVANRYSEPSRMSTVGRRNLLALQGPSSTQSSIRCYTRNEPISMGDLDDDGDIRVIVRNQPYTSQRSTIIEAAPNFGSSYMSPGYDDGATIQQQSGGGCGCAGKEGGGFSNMGYDYGFGGQHSATVDVSYDQAPEYTSDVGLVQQGTIYPSLSQPSFY